MMRNLTALILLFTLVSLRGQTVTQNLPTMKLNAGIFTQKLTETKTFYTNYLGFGVTFENDFHLLLHTPNREAEISFTKSHHPTQQPFFQTEYGGTGMYLTIELENVDALYAQLKDKGVDIKIEMRDEPWGDRHFAVEDPNGIGIDFVTYTKPAVSEDQ